MPQPDGKSQRCRARRAGLSSRPCLDPEPVTSMLQAGPMVGRPLQILDRAKGLGERLAKCLPCSTALARSATH